jgi:hypothetical protein
MIWRNPSAEHVWRRYCAPGAATGGGTKPYNIVRDISSHRSGQSLGGAYIVKANPRVVFGDVIVIICHQGRTRGGRRFYRPKYFDPKEEK